MSFEFLLLLAVIGLVIIGGWYLIDRYRWNGGVCRQTGERWKLAGEGEDGDRIYMTKSGQRVIIGWPVDKADMEDIRKKHK